MTDYNETHGDFVTRCDCGCKFFYLTRTDAFRGHSDPSGNLVIHKHLEEENVIECRECDSLYGLGDFKDVLEDW